MNIDYTIENYRFNARVSTIIYNKDKTKVLLFKVEDGRDYFLLPGGRIEMYEDSLSAIKREVYEELGYDLTYTLCSINENFVTKDNIKISQYNFCYKAIYDGIISEEKFVCKDNNNQYFYWVDVNKIDEYILFPKSTYALIKDSNEIINHIIEK